MPTEKKMMKPEPPNLWQSEYNESYEDSNYGSGLSGYVLRNSHKLVEKTLPENASFPRVLEIGAGSSCHIKYLTHDFEEYWVTDGSEAMLSELGKSVTDDPRVHVDVQDAKKLSYDDNSFDRVVACHVLEHIPEPHLVLAEMYRVVKPGGVLSIVLPSDPGLAWRLGRNFGPRAEAKRNGLHYDYVMAREHVNPINNLVALIDYHFDTVKDQWWPLRVPACDINLIYVANVFV